MLFRKIFYWFWSRVGNVSITFKIMGIVLALATILILVITIQIRNNWTATLTRELEKHGLGIVRTLAARSTDLILTNNTYDLYQYIRHSVENEAEMRYALVLDSQGNLLSSSFGTKIPVGLDKVNGAPENGNFGIKRVETDEGPVLDIAVPIFGGRAGIARVGMSTFYLEQTVADSTRQWLMIVGGAAVVGLFATYWMTRILAKPILDLLEATKAITRGELQRKAGVWAHDEIGKLAISFNEMTDYLAEARYESDTFQAELIRRNVELAALNSISNEINHVRVRDDALESILVKVARLMDVPTCWINIVSEDGSKSEIISHFGLSEQTVREMSVHTPLKCACVNALRDKSSVLVSGDEQSCPVLETQLPDGQVLQQHVAVPLVSRANTLGLLHVVSYKPNTFKTEHLKILDTIGQQVGIALENADLWQELEQNEKLLGELLQATISAQEMERQRISRELHDQTGQALTSLMVGLKLLGQECPQDIKHKIEDIRNLTAQTLEEVHNLALELRPSALDDLGLVATLQQYIHGFSGKYITNADFQAIGFNGLRLSSEVEITIYRIIQEALTNTIKHAEAKQVSVLLETRDNKVIAIIEDNGKGFDIKQVSPELSHRNLGLYGMRERALLIGGKLTIESQPGRGTTIFVEVPLQGDVVI